MLLTGRTPPGVRELKPEGCIIERDLGSRTPPGVRELKRFARLSRVLAMVSHPSRGA